MKVVPKLSSEQLCMLERIRRSELQTPPKPKARPPQPSAPAKISKLAEKTLFAVTDRVELVRDVVDTAYRTGQRGVITALHGIPARIAEVEVDGSAYSDVVRLDDLRIVR